MSQKSILSKKHIFSPWLVVAIFILCGSIYFLTYRNMPIVRNALIYEKIANHLMKEGGGLSHSFRTYNKPLGFVWISLPFIKLLGGNIGLKVVSFLGTVMWSLSIVLLFYRLKRYSEPLLNNHFEVTIYALFTLFNPLVFYQFISAYPDIFFAFGFLWSIYFMDRMLSLEVKWFDNIMFVISTLFSIGIKQEGFVIFPILFIFLISRSKVIKLQVRNNLKGLLFWFLGIIILIIITIFIQSGKIVLFNTGDNIREYMSGDNRLEIIAKNIISLKDYIFLSFSILTILLFWWPSFKKYKEWYLTIIIFILSLLFYNGTRYNLRYFIALSPFIVWVIGNNFKKATKIQKILVISSFIIINFINIAYYNSISFHKFIHKRFRIRFTRFDNLRLTAGQYEAKKDIDSINKLFREGKDTLIFVSRYYGDAEWYIWQRSGLFPEGLRIIYVYSWNDKLLSNNNIKEAIVYERRVFKKGRKKNDKSIEFTDNVRIESLPY